MADRIRKNNVQATAGSYDGVDTSATMPSNPACISSSAGCTQNQLVAYDIREWAHNFVNVSGASNYVSALPNGVGRVRRGVGNLFTITVSWNETDWDNANPNQRVATTETLSLNMSL
jgi:type IV pilus assembly protein PilV